MLKRFILGISVCSLLISCKSEYKFLINSPNKILINQKLTVSISEKNNKKIDSVQFLIDSDTIKSNKSSISIAIANYKLGKHTITAIVHAGNKTEKISTPIYFMADAAPEIYTYEIINTYPHDTKAYTQGLEYYNGFLYEGTGRKGTSFIRKVELETGKVIQQENLNEAYFGEGITIFNNKLYQLTWQDGFGIVYDLASFKKEREFKYTKSREGWGLTHNGTSIIKSDGTERIWFLNPDTLVEETYIEAYTNQQKVEKLNELEYVDGKIYANIWQKNSILIVNAKSGKVEGVVDLNGLKEEMQKTQQLEEQDEVLNGIAYDKLNNRLFVTGKNWGKLFEIKLQKK